jgi:hypothetical protein
VPKTRRCRSVQPTAPPAGAGPPPAAGTVPHSAGSAQPLSSSPQRPSLAGRVASAIPCKIRPFHEIAGSQQLTPLVKD